jgi:ABC-2 type transport system ATP-binding protein
LAEVEQLCSRVGVLDRGRLVLQDELATLTAPTGSTVVHTPVPDRVRAALDGRVSSIDDERVVVRGADPAEVNALLVGAGIPVTGLALERPTLEEVVLAAAGTSTDRVEARR